MITLQMKFMGEDVVVKVDYRVTSWGAPSAMTDYGGDPEEPPEWEVESIVLTPCNPSSAFGPSRKITGALHDYFAEHDEVCEAIADEVCEGPADFEYVYEDYVDIRYYVD